MLTPPLPEQRAIALVLGTLDDKIEVNRLVNYLGLAHELKAALARYTESGGTGRTALDQEEAVAVMLEKHEVCCGLFRGLDCRDGGRGGRRRLGTLNMSRSLHNGISPSKMRKP